MRELEFKGKEVKVMRKRESGFTLVDLLIVLAIIAILAASVFPNFLEARVRSKVSRAKAGMRLVDAALEAYRIDHIGYPPFGAEDPDIDFIPGVEPQFLEPHWLTTPMAYLSNISSMIDPFRNQSPPDHWLFSWGEIHWKMYNYSNFDDIRYQDNEWLHDRYGDWRLTCSGPDTWRFNSALEGPDSSPVFAVIVYDPTNGTVSVGDIYLSSLSSDVK